MCRFLEAVASDRPVVFADTPPLYAAACAQAAENNWRHISMLRYQKAPVAHCY
jgi:hypothetical protein